ncbi:MAG: hypothetical protein EXR71_10365 [Myxococcales bacterium]|nr:hypothetical protein [Myxococcales bacterium]
MWLLAGCLGAASPVMAPTPVQPVSAPRAVPLALDHDLFTASAGIGDHFRVTTWADGTAWPTPLHLRDAPDALAVTRETTIAVGQNGRTLYVVTAGYGGLDSKGVAAELDVVYASGRTDRTRLLVGEHAWPAWAGATGRATDALVVGRNAGGDVLTAAVRAIPIEPGAPVERLVLRPRGGLALYLLAVAIDAGSPSAGHAAADEGPPEGYPFAVPLARSPALPGPPAALRGPVRVEDEALVVANGSPARFWGVNLVGKGALPAPERAEAVADGLAARGFDLVRLHHIDTEATLLNPRRLEPGQPLASPAALDRLDRLHAALRARGVYQYVEMWTQRAFREGEGVPGPEGVPVGNKYVGHIWPAWREAQKAWFRAVWARTNPYTGLRYADDPAVALVELSNENSLLTGWSSGALEKLPALHRRRFDELWNGFLSRRYGSDSKLASAWQGSGRPGLQEGETLVIGTVAREPATRARTELYPIVRSADLVAFYAELEAAYYAEMRAFVRDELGFTAPLVCGTSLGVPLADRQLAACDVIDLHAYWDPISESTAFYDRSLLGAPDRWFERLAGCQAGKPCTLSEIQHSWPNRYSQEAPLLWATIAARQGIDAVLWFAWSHGEIRDAADGPDGALDLEGRFGADVQLEPAGELYRRLPEAAETYTRWWSDDGLRRELAEPSALWLPETVGVRSWLDRRIRVAFGGEGPPPAVVASTAASAARVSWSPGRLVVDGEGVAAVVGSARPTAEAPNPAALALESDRFVAASLVSRHGTWLLTTVGRTDRVGSRWSRGVPGMALLGGGPALLERLTGHARVTVPVTSAPERLGADARASGAAAARRADGSWVVDLDADSPWARWRAP